MCQARRFANWMSDAAGNYNWIFVFALYLELITKNAMIDGFRDFSGVREGVPDGSMVVYLCFDHTAIGSGNEGKINLSLWSGQVQVHSSRTC